MLEKQGLQQNQLTAPQGISQSCLEEPIPWRNCQGSLEWLNRLRSKAILCNIGMGEPYAPARFRVLIPQLIGLSHHPCIDGTRIGIIKIATRK